MGVSYTPIHAVTGTTISSANNNTNLDAILNATTFTYQYGSISAFGWFHATNTGTFTHNMGIQPVWCGMTESNSNSTNTFGYDWISISSTIVNLWTSNQNFRFDFVLIAL